MDRRETALLAVAGIAAATVVVALLSARYLALDGSPAQPFVLLAREPFAWIVVVALVVAALGHVYLE